MLALSSAVLTGLPAASPAACVPSQLFDARPLAGVGGISILRSMSSTISIGSRSTGLLPPIDEP
jgi:hypothetical protein